MPTRYSDRIKLPLEGAAGIRFTTASGLTVAVGYSRIVLPPKGQPLIEFEGDHLITESVHIPAGQKWRLSQPHSPHVEYRSRDYRNVKITQPKQDTDGGLKKGMYYASVFDLLSDQYPVLIDPLRRRTA